MWFTQRFTPGRRWGEAWVYNCRRWGLESEWCRGPRANALTLAGPSDLRQKSPTRAELLRCPGRAGLCAGRGSLLTWLWRQPLPFPILPFSHSPLSASRAPSPPFWLVSSIFFPIISIFTWFSSRAFPWASGILGKKKDRSVSPSLVVHLEIQSTFLLVSGMVCVCVREKERKKGKETVTVVTVLRVLRSKPSKLKNGGPGDTVQYRVCIWEVGLEEAETAGILYFTLITFAMRESVPKPPGRPCYPVLRRWEHATPKPATSACWSLGAEGAGEAAASGRELCPPHLHFRAEPGLPGRKASHSTRKREMFLSLEKGIWSRDGSAQRHLFPRIALLSHSFPPYTFKSLSR